MKSSKGEDKPRPYEWILLPDDLFKVGSYSPIQRAMRSVSRYWPSRK
jgi:hypothetical protein